MKFARRAFFPGLDYETPRPAGRDASGWGNFDPAKITRCSPDPQAIRSPDEKLTVALANWSMLLAGGGLMPWPGEQAGACPRN